jgi:hypothetical protein
MLASLRASPSGQALAPVLAGLLLAAPCVAFAYPPMGDLPAHEAIVGLLRHAGDAAFAPPGLYVHNWGHSNQLFYVLAWALSYPSGLDLACKLVAGLTMVALPLAAARFARHIGASPWAALLVAPVAMGWLFYRGLLNNLMGLAALLAMLPLLDRLANKPSPRRAGAALLGLLLLYETHELMLIVYCGAALLFAAGHPLRARETALRLTPFLVGVGLSVLDHFWSAGLAPAAVLAVPLTMVSVPRKLLSIPSLLFGRQDAALQYCFAGLVALALVLLAAERLPARTAPSAGAATGVRRDRVHAYRFELLGLSCLLLYLVLPSTVHGAGLVYNRFLAPAFVILGMCLSARRSAAHPSRAARMVLATLPVATLCLALPAFAEVSRSVQDLDQVAQHVERDSAVLELDMGPPVDSIEDVVVTVASGRVLAYRGGRMLASFAESPIAPVMVAHAFDWQEPLRRITADEYALEPAHDLTRFRYVLLHTPDPGFGMLFAVAVAPEGQLVAKVGEWFLLESTLPVVPLLSPDVPAAHAASLRTRMQQLRAATHAHDEGDR